jgi:hypothetical protein
MDLASVAFVKQISESVYFIFNIPEKFILCYGSDADAQRVMRNGDIIIPPREFEHLSRRYNRVKEVGDYME